MKAASSPQLSFFIAASIAIATLATYASIKDHDFITLDDDEAIFANTHVNQGLSWESLRWAFTDTSTMTYWHPLVWLSYMLDCELFGLWPAMHHLHSLLLHLASALVLFWCLRRMTGRPWPSAFVALAFALHPLQVESVAWATERSNTLSGLYWMLTMAAYVRYAARPGIGRYLPVFVSMALGLMCKPILVTLPCVFLLLDFWPLRRLSFSWGGLRRPVLEKVPLFALAAASVFISVVYYPEFMASFSAIPASLRLLNIPFVYLHYLGKVFWPQTLAVLEHFQPMTSYGLLIGGAALLLAITIWCAWPARRRPYLIVGWLWYLGVLVPALDTVWNGSQTWTYRANYLPVIGVFVVLAYGLGDLMASRARRVIGALLAVGALLAMAFATYGLLQKWRDDDAFFIYNLSVDPYQVKSHNNYGAVLYRQGLLDEAIWHFKMAAAVSPQFTWPKLDIIKAYLRQGSVELHVEEIKRLLGDILLWEPDNATAYWYWAQTYDWIGDQERALLAYEEVARLQPENGKAWLAWGTILEDQGNIADAIEKWRVAIWMDPDLALAHFKLGLALAKVCTNEREALAHTKELMRLRPEWLDPIMELRQALALHGQPAMLED